MFVSAKPQREETFDQALIRLNLTEADVKSSITTYRNYALLFLVFAVLALAYAFFLLFRYGTITGWMLGMAMCGLFVSQAFKYDFWAFQMRRRKLGATFSDWKKAFLGEKDSA
jgi:intracellular multiplication protein IcmV